MHDMSRPWVDLVVKNFELKASLKFGAAASLSHEGHLLNRYFLSYCYVVFVELDIEKN
jgi:hypothetical protein